MTGGRQSDAAVRERRERVLTAVREGGEARVEEIATRFGVSAMTARRDLDWLYERGLVQKLRGRVTPTPAVLVESSAEYRMRVNTDVKAQLSAAALDTVVPGTTVMIDDSTTCLPLAGMLAARSPITLVTNFVEGARVAGSHGGMDSGVDVVLAGGRYRRDLDSCVGAEVSEALRGMRADVCFIAMPAIASGSLYHPIRESVAVKQAMLAASTTHVLLTDATKFGRSASYLCADASDFDLIIVEASAPAEEVRAFDAAGVRVNAVGLTGPTDRSATH